MTTEFAREMIQSGFNDYFINGNFILGCAIGFFLGIELLILLDIASGIMIKHESFVMNFIEKYTKKQKKEA